MIGGNTKEDLTCLYDVVKIISELIRCKFDKAKPIAYI